jgi:hypothetical protein
MDLRKTPRLEDGNPKAATVGALRSFEPDYGMRENDGQAFIL